jgi:hypothetical protein
MSKELTMEVMGCSGEALRELEKLYYESTTRERILALTLANDSLNLTGTFNKYYNEYQTVFQQYEECKSKFYDAYIHPHAEHYSSWEVNFTKKVVVLYE